MGHSYRAISWPYRGTIIIVVRAAYVAVESLIAAAKNGVDVIAAACSAGKIKQMKHAHTVLLKIFSSIQLYV